MSSRDMLLSRVRAALDGDRPAPEGEIVRRYHRHDGSPQAEIVDLFAERVAEYRAVLKRVDAGELADTIAEACRQRGLQSLVVPHDIPAEWLPPGVEIMRDAPDTPLPNKQLDRSGGVLTGCALGIAQTGTIVLDGGAAQGRRAITLLPDYHLCVVFEDQVVGLVPEAIERLGPIVRDGSNPITFISGPSATSDIELKRVEGVHGPRTLEVLLVHGAEDR